MRRGESDGRDAFIMLSVVMTAGQKVIAIDYRQYTDGQKKRKIYDA